MTDLEIYEAMDVQIKRAKAMNLEVAHLRDDLRIRFKDAKEYLPHSVEALKAFLDGMEFSERIAE